MTYRTYTPEEPKLGWFAAARETLSRVFKPTIDLYKKYERTGQFDTLLGLTSIGLGAMFHSTVQVAAGVCLTMRGLRLARRDLLQQMQRPTGRGGHGPRLVLG